MSIERQKKKQYVRFDTDRLSSLPEDVVIHILSFLDTKYAVQASLSLKKWVHLWKLISDLNFDSSVFRTLSSFDKFVVKVLTLRDDSVKINKLTFSRKKGIKSKLFGRVTKYAVTHDVQHLNICGYRNTDYIFKDQLGSSNSIISLKVEGFYLFNSLCLENLVTLHLDGVKLIGLGNFSGYPNLRTLTLKSCSPSGLFSLSIVAPQLLRLSILHSSLAYSVPKLMLSTQRLTFFKMEGFYLPSFQSDELMFLTTVDMDMHMYYGCTYDDCQDLVSKLMHMLMCFYNVNSLRLSWSLVELLSMFPDVLARQPSPFCNLKSLSIAPYMPGYLACTSTLTYTGYAMTYLLKNTPDANVVFELPRR